MHNEKKKTNGRRKHIQVGNENELSSKMADMNTKRKKFCDKSMDPTVSTSGNNSPDDLSEDIAEDYVELFLDWSTVSQLIQYYGNPTVYTIQGLYFLWGLITSTGNI